MKRDRQALANIDRIDKRKQNRTRRLSAPPNDAEPGDTILVNDDVLVFDEGDWINFTKPLRDRIAVLEYLNNSLEERIIEEAIERERERQENNLQTQVAFHEANPLSIDNPIQPETEFRELSPLEIRLLDFSLCDTYDPDEIRIRYPRQVTYEGRNYGGLYTNAEAHGSEHNSVEVSTGNFPYANEIDGDSTVEGVDVLRPQNIEFFSTVVHEMTHHFQFKYELYGDRTQDGIYSYTEEELKNPESMGLEQIAAATDDWFVIAWQIENSPPGTPVNLTGPEYWNLSLIHI